MIYINQKKKEIASFDMLNRSTGPANNLFNSFDLQSHTFLANMNVNCEKRKREIDFKCIL